MRKIAVLSLCLALGVSALGFLPGSAEETGVKLPTIPADMKPLSGGVTAETYGLSDDVLYAEGMVKQHHEDPEAWFLLGVALSRTPYVERALYALDRARHYAKKSPEGFALFDRKIAEYEHMRAKSPDDPTLLYRIGFGYYMRGYAVQEGYIKDTGATSSAQWSDKAEAAFRHLLLLNPKDYQAMNYLGYLLAERDPKGNFQQAVDLWKQSLAVNDTQNAGAHVLMGQAAMRQGNLREAMEQTTLAIKARNEWLEAHKIDPSTVKLHL